MRTKMSCKARQPDRKLTTAYILGQSESNYLLQLTFKNTKPTQSVKQIFVFI